MFPNIYRDMRHPHKYGKALRITYIFTVSQMLLPIILKLSTNDLQYCLDLSMGVIGYLMFGEGLKEEITSNIFVTKGYPHALSICLVVFIAIIPITKIPLKYVLPTPAYYPIP